jgi:hypothetical protein
MNHKRFITGLPVFVLAVGMTLAVGLLLVGCDTGNNDPGSTAAEIAAAALAETLGDGAVASGTTVTLGTGAGGVTTLSEAVIVPAGVTLVVPNGKTLTVDDDATLTIAGTITLAEGATGNLGSSSLILESTAVMNIDGTLPLSGVTITQAPGSRLVISSTAEFFGGSYYGNTDSAALQIGENAFVTVIAGTTTGPGTVEATRSGWENVISGGTVTSHAFLGYGTDEGVAKLTIVGNGKLHLSRTDENNWPDLWIREGGTLEVDSLSQLEGEGLLLLKDGDRANSVTTGTATGSIIVGGTTYHANYLGAITGYTGTN